MIVELPQYEHHKKVWALQIRKIELLADGSAVFSFFDDRYGSMNVSRDYMEKHDPDLGGYYMIHDNGRRDYLPAKEFESTHTLIK